MNIHSFIRKGETTTMARQLDDGKRHNILDAARIQFGERGFKSTTIKEIADTAEVAPGSIYTYFTDKEDLFRATVEAGWDEFNKEMHRIITLPGSYRHKLERVIIFGFDLLKRLYPILRGMLSEAARLNLLQKNIDLLCRDLEGLLTQIQARGAIVPIPLTAAQGQYLLNIVVSGILFRISMVPPETLDQEIENMKTTILAGLIQFFTPQADKESPEGEIAPARFSSV